MAGADYDSDSISLQKNNYLCLYSVPHTSFRLCCELAVPVIDWSSLQGLSLASMDEVHVRRRVVA